VPAGPDDLSSGGVIRPAEPADAALLAEIDRRASAGPRRDARYVDCCRGVGIERALVHSEAGAVAGFLVYACVVDEGTIINVAVEPDHQGRGIGRALMTAAMEAMRREKVRVCLLEVRESNTAARRLYYALGFRVDGRRRGYYPVSGGREDALLMSRPL
jgi:ribosomal-protein-alanine N-acetyltransferase